MVLPFGLVEDQCAHHTPTAPESATEVLARVCVGAPALETGRDDAWDHDNGVFGVDAFGLEVQTDGEGVVGDGVAFMLLRGVSVYGVSY